jgi:flagellar P-ring protein precursor FlgI
MGKGVATALDGRLIQVKAPTEPGQRIAFLSRLENLNLNPGTPTPRVIINPRTGSIVMNQLVSIEQCAIAHGNLSVTITADPQVSQPNALSPRPDGGDPDGRRAGEERQGRTDGDAVLRLPQ